MDYLQYLCWHYKYSSSFRGFKPYYKWITFNTYHQKYLLFLYSVLNLIINGLPSIRKYVYSCNWIKRVLNLIINGLPSIRIGSEVINEADNLCFKPYYKWITFNTTRSIGKRTNNSRCFKPYYKWITFNTIMKIKS